MRWASRKVERGDRSDDGSGLGRGIAELDFLQDCELSEDDELECDGDNAFQGIEFVWERE